MGSLVSLAPSTPTNAPRLPEDLWNDIFKLALPSISEDFLESCLLSKNHAPMSLTQTCREWRHIAMVSPLLWNRIYFKLEKSSGLKISPRMELLEHTMQLSASAPLHIYGVGGHQSMGDPLLEKIFDLMLPTLPRWKHVYLSLPDVSFNRLASYNLVAGSAELLSLSLTTMDVKKSQQPPSLKHYLPSQLWANSPLLQHLALNFSLAFASGPTPTWKTGLQLSMPFSQLTFLEIGGLNDESVTVTELHSILNSCASNLVTGRFLAVEISAWPLHPITGEPIQMKRIKMPCLKNLLLSLCVSDEYNSLPEKRVQSLSLVLATFVVAPQLISLALHHDANMGAEALIDFVETENCQYSLEELDFYESSTGGKLVEVLKSLPCLKILRRGLHDPTSFEADNPGTDEIDMDIDELFFTELSEWNPETSQFTVCPFLKEIDMDYYNALDFQDGSDLTQMIEKRLNYDRSSNVNPRFKTLRLTNVPDQRMPHRDVKRLLQLREEPFNLSLHLTSVSTYTNERYLYARQEGFYREDGEGGDDDATDMDDEDRQE